MNILPRRNYDSFKTCTGISMALTNQQPVSPSLKQRLATGLTHARRRVCETYDGMLTRNNGRDDERDMLAELLDFCQYQE